MTRASHWLSNDFLVLYCHLVRKSSTIRTQVWLRPCPRSRMRQIRFGGRSWTFTTSHRRYAETVSVMVRKFRKLLSYSVLFLFNPTSFFLDFFLQLNLIDWLPQWSIDWLFARLLSAGSLDWLIDPLIDWLIDWSMNRLKTHRLIDWLMKKEFFLFFIRRFTDRSAGISFWPGSRRTARGHGGAGSFC